MTGLAVELVERNLLALGGRGVQRHWTGDEGQTQEAFKRRRRDLRRKLRRPKKIALAFRVLIIGGAGAGRISGSAGADRGALGPVLNKDSQH